MQNSENPYQSPSVYTATDSPVQAPDIQSELLAKQLFNLGVVLEFLGAIVTIFCGSMSLWLSCMGGLIILFGLLIIAVGIWFGKANRDQEADA